MKLRIALFKYLQRWRKERLYQQWVEKAGLPPEAVPKGDITPKIDKLRLGALYILLGVSLMIFGLGLILLIMQSC